MAGKFFYVCSRCLRGVHGLESVMIPGKNRADLSTPPGRTDPVRAFGREQAE